MICLTLFRGHVHTLDGNRLRLPRGVVASHIEQWKLVDNAPPKAALQPEATGKDLEFRGVHVECPTGRAATPSFQANRPVFVVSEIYSPKVDEF